MRMVRAQQWVRKGPFTARGMLTAEPHRADHRMILVLMDPSVDEYLNPTFADRRLTFDADRLPGDDWRLLAPWLGQFVEVSGTMDYVEAQHACHAIWTVDSVTVIDHELAAKPPGFVPPAPADGSRHRPRTSLYHL